MIREIQVRFGPIPVVVSALSIAEIGHGVYRAPNAEVRQRRRSYLDKIKATLPIQPMTEHTAEIVARVMGEQATQGVNLPITDVIIAASALELGFAVGTGNLRDFSRIPGLHVIRL